MILPQKTLDAIRQMNKRITNKVLIHIAGRKFGHFAILTHTGRKTGKEYHIPIIAEPVENGFVIALTYGKKVDWYENVSTANGAALYWKKQDYTLSNPHFVDAETGLSAFPALLRGGLKKMGVTYFLRLDVDNVII